MTKQLKIDDLIPALKKGWIACDFWGHWVWFEKEPKIECKIWHSLYEYTILSSCFDIEPFDGNWKCSLRRVK